MDVVIEDDDSHHYSETEELSSSLLNRELYWLREGVREGVGDKIMS